MNMNFISIITQIMNQKMQQQTQNKNIQDNQQIQDFAADSPQSKPTLKKRLFNIKKAKHLRQKKSMDIFNNPIYAGLIDEELNSDNIDNFGPWMRQMQLKNSLNNNKDYKKKQKQQTAQNFKQRLMKYNFQNQEKISQQDIFAIQNPQYEKQEENYPQNQNTNLMESNDSQNNSNNTHSSTAHEQLLPTLMRSKSQIKRWHEIKYTSLDLNKFVPLNKKHDLAIVKNSSPKIPKLKHSYSGSLGNLNIISRYFTPKQLLPLLKKKSSNVIYNYCCRDQVQNGNLLNMLKQRNYEQKNIFKEQIQRVQQKFNKTIHKPLNHLQLYHQLKRRRNSNSNVKDYKTVRLKQ